MILWLISFLFKFKFDVTGDDGGLNTFIVHTISSPVIHRYIRIHAYTHTNTQIERWIYKCKRYDALNRIVSHIKWYDNKQFFMLQTIFWWLNQSLISLVQMANKMGSQFSAWHSFLRRSIMRRMYLDTFSNKDKRNSTVVMSTISSYTRIL